MASIHLKSFLLTLIIAVAFLEAQCGEEKHEHRRYGPRRKGEFHALTSSSGGPKHGTGNFHSGLAKGGHHDELREFDDWNRDVRFVAYSGAQGKSKERPRNLYEPAPPQATVGLLKSHPHGKPKKPIFCYYGSSANTRPSVGKFFPENIDPFLCTHLIFAFVNVKKDGSGLKPNNIDDLTDKGLYARTQALRKQNPDLKILLAVGGWKIGSKPFLPVIKNRSTWRHWITNVIAYLRENNFDGFDMDWEFPGWRGSGPEDQHKFTLLLKDLYEAFAQESRETGKPKLLLTLATASSVFYIEKSYEPGQIHKYVDYMLLMTYNYHGSGWEKHTGHHSPILPHPLDPEGEQRELYVLWSIKYWLQFGVPKEKLILGIPTYGLGWKLKDHSLTGVRSPADGGNTRGKYTEEQGILSHYEICEHILQDGWQVQWIDSQKVPYAHGQGEWVGFESPDSIYIKAMTILKEGLGGAFIWSVEMDDFSGHCGGPKYPLLKTVYEVFTNAKLSGSLTAPASHNGQSSSGSASSSSAIHNHAHSHGSVNSHGAATSSHESSGSYAESGSHEGGMSEGEEDYGYYYDSSSSSHDYDDNSSDYGDDYNYDDEASAHVQVSVDCHKLGLGIHADPSSCHHFLLCIPSSLSSAGATRMACPEGTMYDKTLKVCNHEHAVNCQM